MVDRRLRPCSRSWIRSRRYEGVEVLRTITLDFGLRPRVPKVRGTMSHFTPAGCAAYATTGIWVLCSCAEGAADPDARGDAGACTAARSRRRSAGRSVYTSQHVYLPTPSPAARQNTQQPLQATRQNARNRRARGTLSQRPSSKFSPSILPTKYLTTILRSICDGRLIFQTVLQRTQGFF